MKFQQDCLARKGSVEVMIQTGQQGKEKEQKIHSYLRGQFCAKWQTSPSSSLPNSNWQRQGWRFLVWALVRCCFGRTVLGPGCPGSWWSVSVSEMMMGSVGPKQCLSNLMYLSDQRTYLWGLTWGGWKPCHWQTYWSQSQSCDGRIQTQSHDGQIE